MTTYYGSLVVDGPIAARRFCVRVPQIGHKTARPLQASDIGPSLLVPLAAGNLLRVFNTAVVANNIWCGVLRLDQTGQPSGIAPDLWQAFFREGLFARLQRAECDDIVGKLIAVPRAQGESGGVWAVQDINPPETFPQAVALKNGDVLSVFEKISVGNVVLNQEVKTGDEPILGVTYRDGNTDTPVQELFPQGITQPIHQQLCFTAEFGFPVELTVT